VTEASDAADKREAPTPQRVERARRDGDVARSRDLTRTAGLLAFVLLGVSAGGWSLARLLSLFDALWLALGRPFDQALTDLSKTACHTGLALCAAVTVPMALAGLLADVLQTGPVWSLRRLAPRLDRLEVMGGLRRMAQAERIADVLLSLVKAGAILLIGALAVHKIIGPSSNLPWSGRAIDVGSAFWQVSLTIALGSLSLFGAMSALDWIHQRIRLMNRLRMSRHDIRQEHRELEGDPGVKARRKQAQQAASQGAGTQAARTAAVLLVNPTHLAVAIDYDRQTCPVPLVSGKGTGESARSMREAAEEAGVPIASQRPLARELHERSEVGDRVPSDLFESMAEVILWARQMRASGSRPGHVAGGPASGVEGEITKPHANPHESPPPPF
jgi:flagellar biosynthesis protein FlhB